MRSNEKPARPRSPREQPAKPALTRQGIIEVALTILRGEGLRRVTMRRIAAVLETGPASLYVYVRNTEDLHAQILDALLAPVTATQPSGGTWEARLKVLLTYYREILFAYPDIARMTMTTQPSGPNYLSLVDAMLSLLEEGGVADQAAAWAADLLLLYVTANAAEKSAWESSGGVEKEFSALAEAITTADADTYPHIAQLKGELLSGDGPERLAWGLDILLAGLPRTSHNAAN